MCNSVQMAAALCWHEDSDCWLSVGWSNAALKARINGITEDSVLELSNSQQAKPRVLVSMCHSLCCWGQYLVGGP